MQDSKEARTTTECWETYCNIEKLKEGKGKESALEGGDRIRHKGRKGKVEERKEEDRMNVCVESSSRASKDTDRSGCGGYFAGERGGSNGGHSGGKGCGRKLRTGGFQDGNGQAVIGREGVLKPPRPSCLGSGCFTPPAPFWHLYGVAAATSLTE